VETPVKLAWLTIVSLAAFALVAGIASASDSATLAAIRSLPVAVEDRSDPAKPQQLAQIAEAVERYSRSKKEAAFLIAWTYSESAHSLRITAGLCRKWECDAGRARGLAQLHRNGLDQATWDRMHGLGNIDSQVEEAARRARGMLGMCPTIEGAFRAMTGAGCSGRLPGVEKRVALFRSLKARM
jgi:hypothetical protein